MYDVIINTLNAETAVDYKYCTNKPQLIGVYKVKQRDSIQRL